VGQGPLKPRMEEEIRRRGLRNLILLPFQSREKVPDMQSAADVMLLTTSAQIGSTSVPSKLITYLAVARPVICAVPALTDVATLVRERELGLVVPPEDPTALADAITSMSALPHADLVAAGRRARAAALERHSFESAVARFDQLFTDVAGRVC
jgi:colanic acid biosynthesis glycosyl transferase WcaI